MKTIIFKVARWAYERLSYEQRIELIETSPNYIDIKAEFTARTWEEN